MTDISRVRNQFEVVVLAGARTKQLLRGCTPRTQGSSKPARLAILEVQQGHVRKAQTPPGERI